jgi:protein ImuB
MPARLIRILKGGLTAPSAATPRADTPLQAVLPAFPRVVAAAELWAGVHLFGDTQSTRLEQLAIAAQRFTPRVSLSPPDGLLLEVKGSLHLFGGAQGLRAALQSTCHEFELTPLIALAPTPLAALAAARAGRELCIGDAAQLTGHLAALPLSVLRWPEDTETRLKRMGVRTLGAVLRLPRAGFARRFGAAQLATLDELTGRARQVLPAFRAPERFRRRRAFLDEITRHDLLHAALAPLFVSLDAFLRARQCAVLELECVLLHRQAAATHCRLPLAAPSADGERLHALFSEYLNQLQLPEPVRACELRAAALLAQRPTSASLWQPGEHGGDEQAVTSDLIERLRARLGAQAVHGLDARSGHRPEKAWAVVPPPRASGQPQRGQRSPPPRGVRRRPLWLLSAPQPLTERGGLPCHGGPLRLVGELERIETGWWDGDEVARDYYTAVDPHGVQLWVFRERGRPHGWFLHGIFG